MNIEIRNLKIARSLSEETTAYTATIYVDGKPAFHASNHGHGGCDFFRPLGDLTEQQVDAYLAVNAPPMGPFDPDPATRALYDNGSDCTLEYFVGRELSKVEAADEAKRIGKKLDKMLATKICALNADGALVTFGKAAPTDANLAAVKARNPDLRVINGCDAETRQVALLAYCPDLADSAFGDRDTDEAVFERLRENRLTAADARYLLAKERRADKPTADLIEMLEQVVAEGAARDAQHKAALDARRAQAA